MSAILLNVGLSGLAFLALPILRLGMDCPGQRIINIWSCRHSDKKSLEPCRI